PAEARDATVNFAQPRKVDIDKGVVVFTAGSMDGDTFQGRQEFYTLTHASRFRTPLKPREGSTHVPKSPHACAVPWLGRTWVRPRPDPRTESAGRSQEIRGRLLLDLQRFAARLRGGETDRQAAAGRAPLYSL